MNTAMYQQNRFLSSTFLLIFLHDCLRLAHFEFLSVMSTKNVAAHDLLFSQYLFLEGQTLSALISRTIFSTKH
ncbi:hypothetical protein LLR08_24070 [Rouxiella badensis]|nr:hypothetical protein [Rouxiella badensis]